MYGTSIADYAKEFIKLAKYAPYIVSMEAARVKRFKAWLIRPLYKALAATEISSLTKLIGRAKQLEARENEERTERELRKKGLEKGQNSRGRSEGVVLPEGQAEQFTHSTSSNPHKRINWRRGQQ